MGKTVGVRQAQKQKTRQAILDASLELLEEQSLSSLGIREVTREVGVAPTAFYRHFRSTADLGVALVEESLSGLHEMISVMFAGQTMGDHAGLIAEAVDVIAAHVHAHPAHVRFLARERHGGVQSVRTAMDRQIGHFVEETKRALGAQPESEGWSEDDLRMLAGLFVDHLVITASALVEAGPEGEEAVKEVARRQLRVIHIGRQHWLD